MLLKFKNASTISLRNLIDKAETTGGIVNHIELSSKEAFDILHEINNNKNVRTHYSYDEDDTTCGIGFRLSGKADQEELNKIVNEWYRRKIGVRFDSIPLYIIIPQAKKVLSTKFARNRKPLTHK